MKDLNNTGSSGLPVITEQPTVVSSPQLSSSPEPTLAARMEWVNRFSSLILLVGGAAYCVGFVVVNSLLSQYGIAPYDFVQPQYVSAGILYILTTVGVAISMWYVVDVAVPRYWASDGYNGEKNAALALCILFIAVATVVHWVLWSKGFNSGSGYPWAFVLSIFGGFLTFADVVLEKRFPLPKLRGWWRQHLLVTGVLKWVVLVMMLLHVSLRIGVETFLFFPVFLLAIAFALPATLYRTNGVPTSLPDYINGPIYGLILLVGSMNLFGTKTYPLIPSYIGGGRPALVAIALTPTNRLLIGRVMGREDSACLMQNISVIHESNEALYILPRGYYAEERAIVIPKREIATYAYQKGESSEMKKCVE